MRCEIGIALGFAGDARRPTRVRAGVAGRATHAVVVIPVDVAAALTEVTTGRSRGSANAHASSGVATLGARMTRHQKHREHQGQHTEQLFHFISPRTFMVLYP